MTEPCTKKRTKNSYHSLLLEILHDKIESGCFSHQVIYIYLKLNYGHIHSRNLGHSAFYKSKNSKNSREPALKFEANFWLVQTKF